jgi:hypothetical protein
MSRKIIKRSGSFIATDKHDRTYTIDIFTEYIDVSTLGGEEWLPGMKSLRTDDGYSVNRLQQGEYQVVQTGVLLFSNEPEAP